MKNSLHGITILTGLVLGLAVRAADPPGVKFTPESLGQALTDLGFEPKDVSLKKTKDVYSITTDRDGRKIFLNISLSTDATVVWFEMKTSPIADSVADHGDAWFRLLKHNANITPAFFTYDPKDKRIHLWSAIDNDGITPTFLRSQIDQFDGFVRKTSADWDPRNFRTLPTLPAVDNLGRKFLAQLDGAWEVVSEERDGKKSPDADVKSSAIVYTFAAGKMTAKSANTREVAGLVWSDGKSPAQVDLVFTAAKVLQKALAKLDGNTLTLCIANPNQPRPTELAAPAGFPGMLIVLKRKTP